MTLKFFILNLYSAIALIYSESRLLETKINFKDKKIYITLIGFSLFTFFLYLITQNFIKVVFLIQVYNICYIYLFRSDKVGEDKIVLASVISLMLYLFSEIIGALFINVFFGAFIDINKINAISNNLIAYAIITLFMVIVNIKPIIGFCISLINGIVKFKMHKFIVCITYILILLSTLLYLIFFDLSQPIKLLLLIIVFAEYSYLIFSIISSVKNREIIQKDLDLMLEITSKYENTINSFRIRNHENKNQLIVIRDLIVKDDAKALKYVDSIINDNNASENIITSKISEIPIGGLKGLIYYKILEMDSKKINYFINVDKAIKKDVLKNINIDLLKSFYKIVGVLIDNAIEEVEKNKRKIISIELYLEDTKFIFKIANEYNKIINLDGIGTSRFSTKGGNHGYGLQLVRDLVNNNDKLDNKTEIIGNLFIQYACIKIKG